jgi:sialic acid synthase SpsE
VLLRNDVTKPYALVDLSLLQDGDQQELSNTIEQVQSIGADGVCLSLFRTDHLISMVHCPDEADRYRQYELNQSKFQELFNEFDDQDFELIPTIYDLDHLEWYADLTTHGYVSVDAGDITFKRLLDRINALQLSPILSIKASKRETIKQALDWLTSSPKKLLLAGLHSADAEELDEQLTRLCGLECGPPGFTDEFGQPTLAERAGDHDVALWKPLYHPDRADGYSLDELDSLIDKLKQQEGDLPSGKTDNWELTEVDRNYQREYRRSLMADRGLPAGGRLDSSMVRELRPGRGMPADKIEELEGILIQRPAEAQQMISY